MFCSHLGHCICCKGMRNSTKMTLNHLEKGCGGGSTLLSVAVAVWVLRLRLELGAGALLE